MKKYDVNKINWFDWAFIFYAIVGFCLTVVSVYDYSYIGLTVMFWSLAIVFFLIRIDNKLISGWF